MTTNNVPYYHNCHRRPILPGVVLLLFSVSLLLSSVFATPAVAEPPSRFENYSGARLQTLDKSTARTMTFEMGVGKIVKFGPLYISLQACRKAPPIETPESTAFLQVWETPPPDHKPVWVFSGWMFASSPALSSMDHPIYDVWVLDCIETDTTEAESETGAGAGKSTKTEDETVSGDR